MTQELTPKVPEKLVQAVSIVSEDLAQNIINKLAPVYAQVEALHAEASALVVESEDDTATMEEAKRLKKLVSTERLNAEKWRKAEKEESLKFGTALDRSTKLVWEACELIEKYLDQQIRYPEIQRLAREAKLREEREAELKLLGITNHTWGDLAMHDEATYGLIYAEAKELVEFRKAKEKAEKERLEKEAAEKAEKERLEKEAKGRADRRFKILSPYRAVWGDLEIFSIGNLSEDEFDLLLLDLSEKQAAHELAEKECIARENAEKAARIKAEREAAEAKKREDDRLEAERKAAEAEATRRQKLLGASDKEKLLDYAKKIMSIERPLTNSKDGEEKLDAFVDALYDFYEAVSNEM